MAPAPVVHRLADGDRPWANSLVVERWGSTPIVTRGAVHDLSRLPGLVAWLGQERVGLLLYCSGSDAQEIVWLDRVLSAQGIGTALLDAVRQLAFSLLGSRPMVQSR